MNAAEQAVLATRCLLCRSLCICGRHWQQAAPSFLEEWWVMSSLRRTSALPSNFAGEEGFDGEVEGDACAGGGGAKGGFEVAQVSGGLFEGAKEAAGIRKRHRLFRLFDHGLFADDDDDTIFGDVVLLAIGFEVEANLSMLRESDVAVHDGIADARVSADVDVVEDDGVFDLAVAVDADVVAQDRELDAATGDDGAARDDRV